MNKTNGHTKSITETTPPPPPKRRRSKIFQILHPTKSERTLHRTKSRHRRSASTSTHKLKYSTHRARANSSSSKSQFDKLKSIISGLFPKKSVRTKPKKHKKKKNVKRRARKERSRSFSFRRKKKPKPVQTRCTDTIPSKSSAKPLRGHHQRTISCHINIPSSSMDYISETEEYKDKQIQNISPNTMNKLLGDIMEEEDPASETEEYKDNLSDYIARDKPPLAPRSSSFMRSFEKRPEYITYYPPASLQDVFNNITVDEEERSVMVEKKDGMKQRISAVDELFELASMTLDYSNFYGYEDVHMDQNDEYELNEASAQLDVSILSSFADDHEYDETLSWK
eukprot:144312_1